MKRRASERDAGETSARSKALCTSISGSNAKRAGPFILGPRLGNSPVPSIVQCLARKDGTDDFYQLKILSLEERGDKAGETQEERQGKMLLHTEYSLLSLLHNQDGVVHHHGLFQDRTCEIVEDLDSNKLVRKMRKRICLVLDCLCAHDFSDKTADLINLQHYVIKEKRLGERETVVIFYDVVRVVEALHKKNIVHRDLKLGNMVLNKRTHRITITNFCLGKHLVSEDDLLKDQRGSPAYISPDVLSALSKLESTLQLLLTDTRAENPSGLTSRWRQLPEEPSRRDLCTSPEIHRAGLTRSLEQCDLNTYSPHHLPQPLPASERSLQTFSVPSPDTDPESRWMVRSAHIAFNSGMGLNVLCGSQNILASANRDLQVYSEKPSACIPANFVNEMAVQYQVNRQLAEDGQRDMDWQALSYRHLCKVPHHWKKYKIRLKCHISISVLFLLKILFFFFLAFNRQSMSLLSGPLQVVPDIDHVTSPENLQEAKVTEESSQYEFENYMRQQMLLAEEKNTIYEAKNFSHKRHFGNFPPIRRLGYDAQPMSPLDAHILAQRYLSPSHLSLPSSH
ncbi:serine/threonine-protein kinase 40 [Bombina bombina]|uniref:serine/threonine-protein kinase 40 n=1 Tax=Bombina bombina TaxID=8345 RepID=UPI00235AB40C|nr:serine/threonine-protein kinase 40 [Bombina bombina]